MVFHQIVRHKLPLSFQSIMILWRRNVCVCVSFQSKSMPEITNCQMIRQISGHFEYRSKVDIKAPCNWIHCHSSFCVCMSWAQFISRENFLLGWKRKLFQHLAKVVVRLSEWLSESDWSNVKWKIDKKNVNYIDNAVLCVWWPKFWKALW